MASLHPTAKQLGLEVFFSPGRNASYLAYVVLTALVKCTHRHTEKERNMYMAFLIIHM